MQPEIRRVIVTDAHRRRTGRCPVLLHSMGTGETFRIKPFQDGFTDVASGLTAHYADGGIRLASDADTIELTGGDDVTAAGYDPASRQRFTVRASGGVSVTLFAGWAKQYWQFAVDDET